MSIEVWLREHEEELVADTAEKMVTKGCTMLGPLLGTPSWRLS